MANDYTIAAVSRTLKILKLYNEQNKELSLTEISAMSGVGKSSALRVMETLQEEGFITKDEESKKYKLGLELYRIASSGFKFSSLKDTIYPHMRKAGDSLGLMSHAAIIEDNKILVISRLWPEKTLGTILMMSQIGGAVPAHCTGVGKVLTAFATEEKRNAILNEITYTKYTENTIISEDAFLTSLQEVRKNGYAVNQGEHESYLSCVTYPIFNQNGEILCAISLTGLSQVAEEIPDALIHETMQTMCADISQEVRYFVV